MIPGLQKVKFLKTILRLNRYGGEFYLVRLFALLKFNIVLVQIRGEIFLNKLIKVQNDLPIQRLLLKHQLQRPYWTSNSLLNLISSNNWVRTTVGKQFYLLLLRVYEMLLAIAEEKYTARYLLGPQILSMVGPMEFKE